LKGTPVASYSHAVHMASDCMREYAEMVEGSQSLSCLTYNLHDVVFHSKDMELEAGAIATENELFGERVLNVVNAAALGKGAVEMIEIHLAQQWR
jgi:hypothetical protein